MYFDAMYLWPRYVSVMHVGLEARNPEPLGHLRVIVIMRTKLCRKDVAFGKQQDADHYNLGSNSTISMSGRHRHPVVRMRFFAEECDGSTTS